MKFIIRMLLLVNLAFLVACADMKMPDITSVFSSSSEVSEVYIGQFPDIPIPRDMTVDSKRALVSTTQDGIRVGLETYDGRVEQASLVRAMAYNMTNRGWSFRGQVVGPKTVQVFEKDSRVAVLYFYPQTMTSAMEIWVMLKMQDGVGLNPTPSFEQVTPNTELSVPPVPNGMQTYTLAQ